MNRILLMHFGVLYWTIETHQQQQTKSFRRILVEPNILKRRLANGHEPANNCFRQVFNARKFYYVLLIFSLLYFSILSNILVVYTAVIAAHRINAQHIQESVSHPVSQAILQSFNPKKNTIVHHHQFSLYAIDCSWSK